LEESIMCGIAGVITTEKGKGEVDRRNFITQAIMFNTMRGIDSTGTFYVPHGKAKDSGYFKKVCHGVDFVETDEFKAIAKKADEYAYWVAHNRASTVGKLSVENAHPFVEGPITLVHNGTLDSTWSLPVPSMYIANEKREESEKIEVDSHLLCHNLATADREEVISSIRGAFALVWHDARDESLYIVRNNRRPLHILADLDANSVYFMSEMEMLWTICKRAGIRFGKIFQPEPGVLVKFSPGSIRPTVKKLPLEVPKSYPGGRDWSYAAPAGGRGHGVPFTEGGGTKKTGTERAGRTKFDAADTVWVGGKMRPVPTWAQTMLLDRNLVVEDRLLMRPIDFVSNKSEDKTGIVIGEANSREAGGVTCMIYGVERSQWETHQNRAWAVRPVCVRYQSEKEPFILCRVVSMKDDAPVIVASSLPRPAHGQYVPGPYGALISLDEFRKKVEKGCFDCGQPISTSQASSVVWVSNCTQPMCGACQRAYRETERNIEAYGTRMH
jgi:hypothetical protein